MKHTTMYKYNNDIELEIGERGILCSMSNYGASCDVVIPRKLPSGEIINAVGRTFLHGEYKIVIISNEITDIAAAAFQSATVEAVVWSAGCKTIPALCF